MTEMLLIKLKYGVYAWMIHSISCVSWHQFVGEIPFSSTRLQGNTVTGRFHPVNTVLTHFFYNLHALSKNTQWLYAHSCVLIRASTVGGRALSVSLTELSTRVLSLPVGTSSSASRWSQAEISNAAAADVVRLLRKLMQS